MRKITFTITEDEIKEITEKDQENLSDEQIKLVLEMVEGDEMLWKDVNNSIAGAIREILAPF